MGNNLIINGISPAIYRAINHIAHKSSFLPKYWIYHSERDKEYLSKHKEIIFKNGYDLCRLKEYKTENCTHSLPQELLQIFFNEMHLLLDMFSRFEGYQSFSNNDKETFIYSQIRHWYNFIINNNIKGYLQFDTPHDLYDYIIYRIMSFLDLKVIILQQSSFYYIGDDDKIIFNRILTPSNDLLTGRIIEHDFAELFNKYYEYRELSNAYNLSNKTSAFTERPNITFSNKPNNYLSKLKNLISNKELKYNYVFSHLENINQSLNIFNFINIRKKIHNKTNNLIDYMKEVSINLDKLKHPFFYFPLQYQPERTSCPEGRSYSNQFLVLSLFREFLDDNIFIIVKEHPKQFMKSTVRNQMHRSIFFYNSISQLKNVKFVDYSISSKDILSHSGIEGVGTIKGNIILEAAINDIPAFYFGNTIWKNLDYTYDCRDQKILQKINKLLKSNNEQLDKLSFEKNFNNTLKGSFISSSSIHDVYEESEQTVFNNFLENLINL